MKNLFLFLLAFGLLISPPAQAQLRIDVTRGNVTPMPIAISDFTGKENADNDMGRQMVEVVSANLKRSGLFKPLDRRSFIQDPASAQAAPNFAQWRAVNAQALVTGVLTRTGDGRPAPAYAQNSARRRAPA